MQRIIVSMLLAAVSLCSMAAGNPQAGQDAAVICMGCHGQDGNSEIAANPRLAGQGQHYLIKQLRDFKTGARKEQHMTSMVEAISQDDIPNLAAWFASQQIKPKARRNGNASGKAIFNKGIEVKGIAACHGCHGQDGRGNDAVGFPSLAGQHAEYIEKQLKDFRKGTRSNDSYMMQSVARALSDMEIQQLAQYIEAM